MVVATSLSGDMLHSGHIRLIQEAKKLGRKLVIIMNDENWLVRKKGYFLLTDSERKYILEHIIGVDSVYVHHPSNPADMTVCEALEAIRPSIFAKGGDRSPEENGIPEVSTCKRLGIKIVYGVGGYNKMNSSSHIIESAFAQFCARQKRITGCGY